MTAALIAWIGPTVRWVMKRWQRSRAARHPEAWRRPIQVVAADVRRLGRQIALVPSGAPMARRRALAAAYDDVLVEAALLLDIPHELRTAPVGPVRDAARLRARRSRGGRPGGAGLNPASGASSSRSIRPRRRGPTSPARWPRCVRRTAHPRWTAPARWHLTLLFLGATPVECVPPLVERPPEAVAAGARDEPAAGRGGRFGSVRRPQVAWTGLDGDVAAAGGPREPAGRRGPAAGPTGRGPPVPPAP